jgi:hypothetical protein
MNYPLKLIVALLLIAVPTGIAVFGASSLQSEQLKVSIAAGSSKSSNGQMSMLVSDEVRHQ